MFVDMVAVLGLLKILKLARLRKVINFMNIKGEAKTCLRLFKELGLIIMLFHWVGCLFYKVIYFQKNYYPKELNWIPPVDLSKPNSPFYDTSEGQQYMVIFFYAILMLTANDIYPKS
jgi:hypothetical protein